MLLGTVIVVSKRTGFGALIYLCFLPYIVGLGLIGILGKIVALPWCERLAIGQMPLVITPRPEARGLWRLEAYGG